MSKSDARETSKISLYDSPDIIAEKLKRAKTDSVDGVSYDEVQRPEVANLVNIFCALSNRYVLSDWSFCQCCFYYSFLQFTLR
jgi:tryptophanyl-tRNA synthetase